jgi:type II secretory pathway predicted ATPase ExeA
LGLLLAVVLEFSDRSIRTEKDAAAVMDLPLLISVPWLGEEAETARWNGNGNGKRRVSGEATLSGSKIGRRSRSKARAMYKEFFGLRANPFNVNPDPRYLFLTRHTEEALACLTYGIQSRKGFVLLTGEVGTGKTTLINKLMEWLRLQQVATAFIFNSRMDVTAVARLHDGGLRHSLRYEVEEPDPAAAL